MLDLRNSKYYSNAQFHWGTKHTIPLEITHSLYKSIRYYTEKIRNIVMGTKDAGYLEDALIDYIELISFEVGRQISNTVIIIYDII